MTNTDHLKTNSNALTFPQIIFSDDSVLLLHKPPAWFVHPPENPRHRRGLKRRTCVQWLKDQHNIQASPAHRLDVATEGILIFGRTSLATSHLNAQFRNQQVEKTYYAVVRGWLKAEQGQIDIPLESDSAGELTPCLTFYKTLAQIEWPEKVSKRFNTSRYSLLEVRPRTGRWHQIRRHMNRISHPIIGDREHGDSHHNRFFRDRLQIDGLCLWAKELSLQHPVSERTLYFESPISEKWQSIYRLFNFASSATSDTQK